MEHLFKELSVWEKETADIITLGKQLEKDTQDDVRKRLANLLNRETYRQSIEVMECGKALFCCLNELMNIIDESESGKQLVKKYKR